MPLLTEKEYKEKVKQSPSVKIKKVEIGEGETPRPLSPPKTTYYFFHPENPQNGYLNKEFTVNIYGKDYDLEIINGTVKTGSKIVSSYLLSKEYILIKEVKNA